MKRNDFKYIFYLFTYLFVCVGVWGTHGGIMKEGSDLLELKL